MRNIIVFFSFVIVCLSNVDSRENPILYPNLPSGKYKAVLKGVIRCVPVPTSIQCNLYINKKSINVTEFKGNITTHETIDDTLNLDVSLSIKDSIGGWKDNVYNYKAPKACNGMKKLLGNTSWRTLLTGLGINNMTCPIPIGVYKGPGVDFSYVMGQADIPKIFFYGTYKLRVSFTKNNEVHGCIVFIAEFIRPWEKS